MGLDSAKLQALRSIEDRLIRELEYQRDVLFLTDMEAEGLYPFTVIKDKNIKSSIHLFSISPWAFEPLNRTDAVKAMLTDLSTVKSVLYIEGSYFLWKAKITDTLPMLITDTQKWCGDLLPSILYQILERKWNRAFFDTHTMQYVPIDEGENLEDTIKQSIDSNSIRLTKYESTMGVWEEPDYPSRGKSIFDEIEALTSRIDGKRICDYLRRLRIKLAGANHIPFESKECPSLGPCAGTCQKCDRESEYLQHEMEKIAPEERVYPFEELTSWEVF